MRRFLSYLLVLFVVISCSCTQPFELQAKPLSKYPIQGILVGSIFDKNSQSSYSIIANGNTLKICDSKTRTLVMSEIKLPGQVISNYQIAYEYHIICKSKDGNLLIRYIYDNQAQKLELKKLFETQTKSSYIVSDLPGMDGDITQSEDKTILYLYVKDKLIKSIKYPKPTIWWHPNYDSLQNIGFDGQDLIFQSDNNKNGNINETRKKIKEPSPIDNAFFQPTEWYKKYIDLYDGTNLWRVETSLDYLGNANVRGPLEIKKLEKGYNQIFYPYEKGLCRVEVSETNSNILVLKHIDDKKMYPIIDFSGDWTAPTGYYLYGYKENGNYKLKCFKFFRKDDRNNYDIRFKSCDVRFLFDLPVNEDIYDSDYYHQAYDYDNVSFNIYTKNFVFVIPNATNW